METVEMIDPTGVSEGHRQLDESGVDLHWELGETAAGRMVSLFLVNSAKAENASDIEQWLFQPGLTVATDPPGILPRPNPVHLHETDPDLQSSALLYRQGREFAVGLGVSVDWDQGTADREVAEQVWTEFLPSAEVPAVVPGYDSGLEPIEMAVLAEANPNEVRKIVGPLLEAYGSWIELRERDLEGYEDPYQAVATDHLELARNSRDRMSEGLELLATDPDALSAFQFTNRVMSDQMIQGAVARAKQGLPVPEGRGGPPAWRAFQIGFILQCLPGLADPNHRDRGMVDLLWFPTGGGKTEAYLGLAAFTMAYRRLRGGQGSRFAGGGTAVLMRYTLRLLTIQQFQRALTMVCACEMVRRQDEEKWGTEPFTIGLWVGSKATPNSYRLAVSSLEVLLKGKKVYENNPCQILNCPWCGEKIEARNYRTDSHHERIVICCPGDGCEFGNPRGIPAVVVDDEIYRNPPSLLIGTVDKFALMPWNGKIQALFGLVDRYCPRHGFISGGENHERSHRASEAGPAVTVESVPNLEPPELVIQDELHLISGPLGTLVGIYETAIDGLCRSGAQQEMGAKIVASTATIRRAPRQVEGLFGRKVSVFPPLGLDSNDSFFAVRAKPSEKPGRRYLGVYAPGQSVKTALVRVYAALLSRALAEFEGAVDEGSDGSQVDPYMTLVGYFNSIRELGGAVRLVEDDVPARLKVLRRRGFGPERRLYSTREMTSRVSSNDIPKRLEELGRTFVGGPEPGLYPLDVLLASNMFSVGVDVNRLGLMVVNGQPKTTAEYIQATSRVGRRDPGLVVTVYNWSRPRDTSHYEKFRHYHETFYQHVEATSVTPFSARARDRALGAVLAAFVRLSSDEYAGKNGASRFTRENAAAAKLRDLVEERLQQMGVSEETQREVLEELADLVFQWSDSATRDEPALVYGTTQRGAARRRPDRICLLRTPDSAVDGGIWPAAMSLRDVEAEVDVVLDDDLDWG